MYCESLVAGGAVAAVVLRTVAVEPTVDCDGTL